MNRVFRGYLIIIRTGIEIPEGSALRTQVKMTAFGVRAEPIVRIMEEYFFKLFSN